MAKIILGRTGLEIEKNGFGALPIQRDDFDESAYLLRKAYENGINFIDTARAYTDSEEKIAYAFKGNPSFVPKPDDGSGVYEAFLKLKDEGKIRHIGFTSHKYELALEAIESGLYETMQFPFNYLTGEKELDIVEKCKHHNMGFIAMKAMSGGLLKSSKAAYAYVNHYDNVVPIWGVQRESELDEFLSYMKEDVKLDDELSEIIRKDREELQGEFCRGCNYCAPCAADIEISQCARMSLWIRRFPSAPSLTPEKQEMMRKIEDCTECGDCMTRCPYELDIPELLKKNYEDYKKILSGEVKVD